MDATASRCIDAPKAKVLIVDDNPNVRDYMRRLLTDGYEVLTAINGQEGLALALRETPDLVLAGIMVPVLDGMELLRAIRSRPETSSILVIFLSSSADEKARSEGLEAGADDFLITPLSARELLARVGAHLKLARFHKETEQKLRASEERLRALVIAASYSVYRMSPDWVEMRQLNGQGFLSDTAEPSTAWVERYILSEDKPQVLGAVEQAISSRTVFELEHRVRRVDGSVGWTLSRAVPLLDADGEIKEWVGSASDITARRRAEQALRASEERLQRVLETDTVGVIFFNHSGTMISANHVFREMTGYTCEEIERGELTWRHITPSEWVQESEAQMRKLAETGRIGPYEKEYFLKNGSRRWMLFAGRDLGDGTIAEYCIDISDQKRAEEALKEREAWLSGQREALAAALNGAPLEASLGALVRTATQQMGPDTRAAFYVANEAGSALHLVAGMSAAYAEAVNGFRIGPESLACGLATHTGRPVLTTDVKKEPLWKPWLWLAEKFDYRGCWSFPVHTAAGVFVGTFAIYSRKPRAATEQDVEFANLVTQTAGMIIARHTDTAVRRDAEEALRESEQNLRAVANIVPDLLWYSSPGARTDWNNDRWFEYTGQILNQAVAWDWTKVIHPDDRNAFVRKCREAVEQGKSLQEEQRVRRHDGEYRWFLIRAEPVHDEEGRLIRMYGAATDVHEQRTARVRLEQEVASRTAELEIQVSERDALLKEVHHRVKNNLHVITSMLEMQARRADDYSAFEQLQEACNRVMSIAEIHELLYKSGSFSAVDLTAYARQIAAHLFDLYRVRDRIQATVEGESVTVDLDRAVSCGLVLNELISNACKHGFPSDARGNLTIQLSRNDGHVRLYVGDTGIGLPLGFDFRSSPSLGLRIVHLLANHLRGAITWGNVQGTSFELQFPDAGSV